MLLRLGGSLCLSPARLQSITLAVQLCSVCTGTCRNPGGPRWLLHAHTLPFHSLGATQDRTDFCHVPPRSFPSGKVLVYLISLCINCGRETSLDVSAVGADNVFLYFPFWLIFNPWTPFGFIPWQFSKKEPLLESCTKALWTSLL